jgi:hypothetical protein
MEEKDATAVTKNKIIHVFTKDGSYSRVLITDAGGELKAQD